MPTDRCRLLPIASASVLALAATLGAGAALVTSPATASGPARAAAPREPVETTVRVGTGTANFCLTPDATRAFAKAGMRLTALAPAKLTGPAARRCVTTPISGGTLNTRFTSGHLDFRGGFDFVGKGHRHLRVSALRGELATSRVTGTVGGSKGRRTDFLAFHVDPARVQVGGGQARARMSFTLTERGVGAFRGAFRGQSPLAVGQRVFDGDGTASFSMQQAGSTSSGTGTAQDQASPAPARQTPGAARQPSAGAAQQPAGQSPAASPRPAADPTPARQNDVAMDPVNAVAAD
ncbi:hypothetical protein CP973_27200 [Streptomyces albofaciens JCM 4342]|uniref:hypothetical protein n=1 Tax=Streptomyces albofaciens TaxID=66866 RepID=UPI001238B40F|nr:hypothetical protein [Streptomyces albofaciens]KAA6212998.1 hypothetical protein CP973_27200 [Streptomyces albofaciens JCM 4342]